VLVFMIIRQSCLENCHALFPSYHLKKVTRRGRMLTIKYAFSLLISKQLKHTYCTMCKMNVEMTNIVYKRLANNRLAILGNCTRCSAKLLKTRVMPTSGISKKKLTPLFSDARKKHGAIKNLSDLSCSK
jgi:hypothetical protein